MMEEHKHTAQGSRAPANQDTLPLLGQGGSMHLSLSLSLSLSHTHTTHTHTPPHPDTNTHAHTHPHITPHTRTLFPSHYISPPSSVRIHSFSVLYSSFKEV